MKFYIDTANVDEIRKANDMGIIAGVTTNPSLIAKEGRDYAETLKEITTIVDGPISGEVKATTADAEAMLRQTYASVTEYAELAQKLPDDVYAAMLYCAMRAVGMNPTPFESFDWANHTVYTG